MFCLKKYDVTALGELLIDFTESGVSDQGNPFYEANPGGAPCNVLAMLQKLGKNTAFIGKVGRDSFGELLRRAVSEQGIDIGNLIMDSENATTLAFVHKTPEGDRSFSFYRNPGADTMLREDEVDRSLLADTKIFHFGSLSMTGAESERATKLSVRTAKAAGALISFDPNFRPALWKDPACAKEKIGYGIGQCDILKISDDEIAFFTGKSNIEEGVRKIREQYHTPLVCATMGKNGSMAYYQEYKVKCLSFPNAHTVETTGAGDTFMACVLNYVLENGLKRLDERNLYEMLRFANAAASIITTKKGALRVMPTERDVRAVLQSALR